MRIRNFTVAGSGILLPFGPQPPRLATACPRYTAPARVSVTLNECLPSFTWATTVHGPAPHAGMKSQGRVPLRSPGRWVRFLAKTFHGPCRRAWDIDGMSVFTASEADCGDRLPSRIATTRYW